MSRNITHYMLTLLYSYFMYTATSPSGQPDLTVVCANNRATLEMLSNIDVHILISSCSSASCVSRDTAMHASFMVVFVWCVYCNDVSINCTIRYNNTSHMVWLRLEFAINSSAITCIYMAQASRFVILYVNTTWPSLVLKAGYMRMTIDLFLCLWFLHAHLFLFYFTH